MATDLTYERELRVRASPETIFELLTDAKAFSLWMGSGARLDPRRGGGFELDLGPGVRVRGQYIEVERPKRVVFGWGFEGGVLPLAPGESRVEFTLIPDGEYTVVRLRHSGLSPALREFHDAGWGLYLPRLAAVAEGRPVGADPLQAGLPPDVVRKLQKGETR